jgi:hypothetical protein
LNYSNNKIKNKLFSSFAIKILAIIFMIIDHITESTFLLWFPYLYRSKFTFTQIVTLRIILRGIGRFSFPLFTFLIVEGFIHTKNVKKYAATLFLFSFISEIPFDMAIFKQFFYWGYQNVFFTLFLGLLSLVFIKKFEKDLKMQVITSFTFLLIAHLLKTDYGFPGVLMIIVLYIFRERNVLKFFSFLFVILCIYLPNDLEYIYSRIAINMPIDRYVDLFTDLFFVLMTCLSYIIMNNYNGKHGSYINKYIFYVFYPLHLFIIGLFIIYFV